jgi:hypothetical protein
MFDYYIFGLQRSGTTFFERMLTNTFNARWLNGAGTWKHELLVPDVVRENNNIVLVNFKNPYTWLESIIFRGNADLLMTATEYGLQDDTGPDSVIGHDSINLANTAKLYAAYAERWLAASAASCVHIVRYEDLLTQQGRDLLAHSILGRGLIDWQLPEPGSLFMSEDFTSDRIDYYLNNLPIKFIAAQIKIINDNIPDDIFTRLGYYKIS